MTKSGGISTTDQRAESVGQAKVVDWLLVLGCCLFGFGSAVMAFFYLPLYVGTVPLPLSAALLGWLTWQLPQVCFRLTRSLAAAAAPAAVIVAVILVLLIWPESFNAGGRLQIYLAQWRIFLLLGAVALAGAARMGLLWGDVVAARVRHATVSHSPTPESGADVSVGAP